MDHETTKHFHAWLESAVALDDRQGVEQAIHALLTDYPELPSQGRSWPEIRQLAERDLA